MWLEVSSWSQCGPQVTWMNFLSWYWAITVPMITKLSFDRVSWVGFVVWLMMLKWFVEKGQYIFVSLVILQGKIFWNVLDSKGVLHNYCQCVCLCLCICATNWNFIQAWNRMRTDIFQSVWSWHLEVQPVWCIWNLLSRLVFHDLVFKVYWVWSLLSKSDMHCKCKKVEMWWFPVEIALDFVKWEI